MYTKSQLGWLNLPHLPLLPPPVTVKQRVVIIPGDQPEEDIYDYGVNDFEKRKVLRREWKTPREKSISVQDQSVIWRRAGGSFFRRYTRMLMSILYVRGVQLAARGPHPARDPF